MARIKASSPIPLSPDFPLRRELVSSNFNLYATQYFDTEWDLTDTEAHPIWIFFHGSGGRGDLPIDNPRISAMLDLGAQVINISNFGVDGSSPAPWRFTYGSVRAPLYTSRMIKEYWVVHSALHFFTGGRPYEPGDFKFLLIGHSLGAIGVFGWGSLVEDTHPGMQNWVSGIVGNGVTSGGSGQFRWNHPNTTIALFSQTLRKQNLPTLAVFADADDYAPPDFARRMQMNLRPDQDNIYFISPGDYSHNWFNERPALFAQWCWDLHFGNPIILDNGQTAVPGAVV